jgi:exopolysaccharide transport family protein
MTMNRPLDFSPTAPAAPAQQNLFNESELRWLLNVLLRRRWQIILPTLAVVLLAALILFSIPPLYKSTGAIALQPQQEDVVDIQQVLSTGFSQSEDIATEVEVMRSRRIANKVIDQLDLMKDVEFNDYLTDDPWLVQMYKKAMKTVRGAVYSLVGSKAPQGSGLSPEQIARENVINNFLDRLEVTLKPETRAIYVAFSSQNPQKAAKISKAVTDAYLTDMLESSYEATLRANQWLSSKISDLQGNVTAAERAVERFRRDANLLQGREGTLISQQISEVNSQLLVASAARAEAEARYAQVRRMVQGGGSAETASDVLRSPIIQSLVAQESEAKRKVAELAEELGPRHPSRVNAESALRDVQSKLRLEINKIVTALANDAEVSRAREGTLRQALTNLQNKMASANSSEVQLRGLEREAEAQRTLLQSFLSRAQETTAQLDSGFQRPMARVIAEPNIPENPYFPPKMMILAVALLGGFIISLAIAALMESLHRGVRSTEELEQLIGLPAIGMIPAHRRAFAPRRSLFNTLAQAPNGVLAESFQSCLTQLLLASKPTPPKTVLITSSTAEEGKTTFSLGLGRTAALGGYRTLVIEADLRRPSFDQAIELPKMPGLGEYLTGKADLQAVIFRDPQLPLHIIPAGTALDQPGNWLRSKAFLDLIDGSAQHYDFIVLDSPPVLAVSDSQLLAPRVDGVLMVIRWAATRHDRAKLSAKQIMRAGGRLLGGVLTLVDTRKHAAYDFADSAYYSQYTRRHYFAK